MSRYELISPKKKEGSFVKRFKCLSPIRLFAAFREKKSDGEEAEDFLKQPVEALGAIFKGTDIRSAPRSQVQRRPVDELYKSDSGVPAELHDVSKRRRDCGDPDRFKDSAVAEVLDF